MSFLSRVTATFFASFLFVCLIGHSEHRSSNTFGQDDSSWQEKLFPKEKEDALKQKIADNPNDALSQYQLAEGYLGAERWADAAEYYERVVKLKPQFADAYYNLGYCYSYLERPEDAVKAFQLAAENAYMEVFGIRMTQYSALNALAGAYTEARRYDEAISTLEKLRQTNPRDESLLYQIGQVYLMRGNNDEAMEIANKLSTFYRDKLVEEAKHKNEPDSPIKSEEVAAPTTNASPSPIEPMKPTLRPTVLYKEKAKYTELARSRKIQGIVLLKVVFYNDGHIGGIEVVRPLPYGLTTSAIKAAQKIRFNPAEKDGQAVSVRGQMEFNFKLY